MGLDSVRSGMSRRRFGFYSECDGKSLEDFEQINNVIPFAHCIAHSSCCVGSGLQGQMWKQADWGGGYGTCSLWKEQGLYNHTWV